MSIVRVYKSTDPGAPPHPSDTRGSMAALLRACLVTGYGSGDAFKAPAGWEEPFAETDYCACFRALEGQKLFYQINDAMENTRITTLSPFDSMSSATTGIGPHGSCYFGKRSTTVTTTDWVVVADEKTAYVSTSSRYGHILGGFGEYYALRPDHPCKGFVMGHSNSSQNGYIVGFGSSSNTNNGLVLTGNPISEGPYTSHIVWVGVCSAGIGQDLARYINGTRFNHPDASIQNYAVEPAWLIAGWDSVGRYLAKLRGVYLPQAFRPKGHKEVFSHGSKTFIALNLGESNYSGTDYQGQGWIDLGPWEEST